MPWARLRDAPVWVRMTLVSSATFGLISLLSGILVLVVSIRHNVDEYHDMLARLSADLKEEYASCGGDLKKMREFLAEDQDEHGANNVFLLVSEQDGTDVLHLSSAPKVVARMVARVGEPSRTYRLTTYSDRGTIVVRVRKTPLFDGRVLSVGYNVTDDERFLWFVGLVTGLTVLLTLLVGAGVSAVLCRRFAGRMRALVRAADAIRGGDYSARVPLSDSGREIRELEEAFNTMSEQNEKTLAELRVLTDNIAHDLRTPLTRLRTAAELQMMGGEMKRPLEEVVSDETSSMLDMINTMLDISQAGYQIDRTPREELELGGFVRHVCDLYSILAEDCGIAFSVSVPDVPVPFSGHRGKVQQLLGNLLDNAVKFTPAGGSVRVTLSDEGGKGVALTVSDTGCGIAEADVPHVFTRFWRADTSRSVQGNGLGLALVKAIVTSYGGTVDCTSRPGAGATFTVTLPRT